MALIKYMPRPQKRRANNGSDRQHIVHHSKQNKSSLSRGKSIAQKFLKSTIYNHKMNYTEITLNLYTFKLNEIPGIIDEIVRCVVIDAPQIKRICFETGYGKPKKAIDIRKRCSRCLTNKLGYVANKSGAPKTFKFLSDHCNRVVIFPQSYDDFMREKAEKEALSQTILDAKKAKNERKAQKKMKKHFVANKWKKNLKYPAPKKRAQPIYDRDGEPLDSQFVTRGGEDDESHDAHDEGRSSEEEVEETEAAFLRNFNNLNVVLQQSKAEGRKRKKAKRDVDIFEGVADKSQKFEYVAPDYQRYKKKKKDLEKEKGKKKIEKLNMNKERDWHCEFCSFKNSKQNEICQMCYMECLRLRYDKFMNVVDANNAINSTEIVGKNDVRNAENDGKYKWHCDLCTFINTGDKDICAMCRTTNEQQEMKLDKKYENYGDGFFADAKPKNKEKQVEKMEEDYAVNGQIASINREYQAMVWQKYSEKQKEIKKEEMLKGIPINNVGFIPHKKEHTKHSRTKKSHCDSNHVPSAPQSNRRRRKKRNKKRKEVMRNTKANEINFDWIQKLVLMGFEYDKAYDAVVSTNCVAFNEALDHLMCQDI